MTPRLRAPRRRCAAVVLAITGTVALAPISTAGAADPPPPPPPPAIAGRCTQYEDELRHDAPPGGWDVVQMSTFMARESSCDPTARSARDTGLLQINDINHAYLRDVLHEFVGRWSLTDAAQNIRAAAALCEYWRGRGESCYFPWKLDLFRAPGAPAGQPNASTPPRTAGVEPTPPPATTPPKPPTAPTPTTAPTATTATTATTAATPTTPTTPTTGATAEVAAAAPTGGRCVQYEPALAANAPAAGWDVVRMSRLMATTSGCKPARRWKTATGLLRISDTNQPWLRLKLGVPVDRRTLTDPVQNIRAAAALCQLAVARGGSCYQPWQG